MRRARLITVVLAWLMLQVPLLVCGADGSAVQVSALVAHACSSAHGTVAARPAADAALPRARCLHHASGSCRAARAPAEVPGEPAPEPEHDAHRLLLPSGLSTPHVEGLPSPAPAAGRLGMLPVALADGACMELHGNSPLDVVAEAGPPLAGPVSQHDRLIL